MGYNPNQPPQGQPGQPPYQPSYGQPQQQGPHNAPPPPLQQPYQPYGQAPFNQVPPLPNYAQQPPQQKRSLRWLWITLGILGVLIVAVCAICGILTANGVGFLAQKAGPVVAVDQYYAAVQKQDYATAYAFLSPDAILTSQNQTLPIGGSQQGFIQAAQLLDANLGTVTSHTVATTGSDTTVLTINVTRSKHAPYSTRFTMVKIGSDWKIKNMEGAF